MSDHPIPDDVRLLSVRQTAEALGCGVRTLWTWRALGLLRPVQVGSRFLRYRVSDVRRFLDKQQEGGR